jgi:transposase
MTKTEIERVDSIPLIMHWLKTMRVAEIIDRVLPHPHRNRAGLSYGQLAVLFLTYLLYMRTHRLSGVEEWVANHQQVLELCTGWTIGAKEATDDRLGDLLTALGEDEARGYRLQREMSQHVISAYELPTEVARYDTSTFSVEHVPAADGTAGGGLLARGHSKDQRPDLLQFKQGLATLDPAGVPILTETIAGNRADDPLYVPAWRQMVATVGHTDFLFVADCKAAALETRAVIDHGSGSYLFPLPMTGQVPATLREAVLDETIEPQPIKLIDVTTPDGQLKEVGRGFEMDKEMTATLEDGSAHTWTERWLFTQSDAQAARQQQGLTQRLETVTAQLSQFKLKKDETASDLLARADALVKRYRLTDLLTVQVHESVTHQKRYIGPGRPGPNRPFELHEVRHVHLTCQQDDAALADCLALAGWRIYVTQVPADPLPLDQAIAFYRDEWLVERGMHRFKRGALPALPLYLRLPERIRGLMLLLLIALQALTLMEFVVQRALAEHDETLAGLVPGNPRMQTARPSAERLLARFDNLHLLIHRTGTHIEGQLLETLSALQRRILALLGVPETVYDLAFSVPMSFF